MTKLLPVPSIDRQQAISLVADRMVAPMLSRLTSPAKDEFEFYVSSLADFIRRGGLKTMDQAIAAAKAGDQMAHASLQRIFDETLQQHELPSVALIEYQRHTDAPKRGRGNVWYKDWRRNHGFMLIMRLTCEAFGVRPGRNESSQQPSAASIVSAALKRHGIIIGEGRLENIWWRQGWIAEAARGEFH
jgi:hypothetical protein